MFESIFSSTGADTSLSIYNAVAIVLSSIVLGLLISIVYIKTNKKSGYSQNFVLTLTILPSIITIIILLVGSNVARAFSLAGAFSIIRFRSESAGPKDLTFIFFALAVGLACGVGQVVYAAIFAVMLGVCIIILYITDFGKEKRATNMLKIIIPEDLEYQGAFDDLFEQYTVNRALLKKVKTTDLGSLYELTYLIKLKDDGSSKEFIDQLRCRNGNLNITLVMGYVNYDA